MTDYFGKYRGTVIDNLDPLGEARIRVDVPGVLGPNGSAWAAACLPWPASAVLPAVLPAIGAGVWVEFEAGNPDCPVWSGFTWDPTAQTPTGGLAIATASGGIIFADADGSITLAAATGARIAVSPSGIEIDSGTGARIDLSGPTVSVNRGALEVS